MAHREDLHVSFLKTVRHVIRGHKFSNNANFKSLTSLTLSPNDTTNCATESEINSVLAQFDLSQIYSESKEITQRVLDFVNDVSALIGRSKKWRNFTFTPILTGSMAEQTKTFILNEIDFICEFKHIIYRDTAKVHKFLANHVSHQQ